MPRPTETDVLIVGAGPVGMTLALDLAWRGVGVTIAERRPAAAPPSFKCNQISARSMEIFRRLGIAGKLRDLGLPPDFPNDVVSATTVTGIEFDRIPIPSRAERYTATNGPDCCWPTPEPTHRVNQAYFEPVLSAAVASHSRIRVLDRTTVVDILQDEFGVTALANSTCGTEPLPIRCRYLVGCDGAKSTVRKRIGARLVGNPEIQRVQTTCIRAPDLTSLLPGPPAWMYFCLNPRRCGTTIAINGRDLWQVHNTLRLDEAEPDAADCDRAIRTILGVGGDFSYEVIARDDWIGRRLIADRFRDGRVFICGDAAHLWIPHGGYGMNAGIADAENLSWLIAATLKGWAPESILDAYQAERQPIAHQVSRLTEDSAARARAQMRDVPSDIEKSGAAGDAVRARFAREAHDLAMHRQCAGGLNFGYFYDASPIIAYDGAPHPPYDMHAFTPSAVPGCRAPHFWLRDGHSLYDALGAGFTLLRLDPTTRVSGIVAAAEERGVPLSILDVDAPEARAVYLRTLALVRPDRHVAWRGDEQPDSPIELVDLVRGASAGPANRRHHQMW